MRKFEFVKNSDFRTLLRERREIRDELPALLFRELIFPRGHDRAAGAKRFAVPAFADAPKEVLRRPFGSLQTVGEIGRGWSKWRAQCAVTVAARTVTGGTLLNKQGTSLRYGIRRIQNTRRRRKRRVFFGKRIGVVCQITDDNDANRNEPKDEPFHLPMPRRFARH